MIEFDVSSLEAGIDELLRRAPRAAVAATRAVAEAILADALERVPRDTHALAKSGRVERRHLPNEPDVIAFAVVFGDEEAPYALAVHDGVNVEVRTGEKQFLRNAAIQKRKLMEIASRAYMKALAP